MKKQDNAISKLILHNKTHFATNPQQWKTGIEKFLEERLEAGPVTVSDLRLPPATGGASTGLIIFTALFNASGDVRKLVLRYDPGVSHVHEYDMVLQYRLLNTLKVTDVLAPQVLAVDSSGEYFGVQGFVMDFVDGTPLPSTYTANGPLFDATPEVRTAMIRKALTALATIHQVDWRALQLDVLLNKGRGNTSIERNLEWYRDAMLWGASNHRTLLDPVFDWLIDNQPHSARLTLCHGDSSLPNYVFKDNDVVAVLDWEFAFIGLPASDLGFQLMAHEVLNVEKPPLPGIPDLNERLAMYEEICGHKIEHWDYGFTIACLKLYIHMALLFRDTPPEMDVARDRYLNFCRNQLEQSWRKAQNSTYR